MKKPVVITGIILAAAGLAAAAYYWESFQGAGPAILPPPRNIVKLLEEPRRSEAKPTLPSSLPLKLPPGFAISIFAKKLPGARVLALDPEGNLLVSLTSQGRVVALPDKDADGKADDVVTVLHGLNHPHGLAFGPGKEPRLYVAETGQVAAYDYDPARLTATYQEKIAGLPPGGRHFTRSLVFLPIPGVIGSWFPWDPVATCVRRRTRGTPPFWRWTPTGANSPPMPRACGTRCSWPSIR